MDAYEATNTVMSRIQAMDPEYASKIMGYILIQDQGVKEMIRLAFSPDPLLLSYIAQAKARLGLSSHSPSSNPPPPPPPPPFPVVPFPQNSPRVAVPNSGGFHLRNPTPSPSGGFPYSAGVVDNNKYRFPFLDNQAVAYPLMSPGGRSDSLGSPYGEDAGGAAFVPNLDKDGHLRPCMDFARGLCNNGGNCKFLHESGGLVAPGTLGSPGRGGAFVLDDWLRLKTLQQQRYAFMAAGGRRPFAYNKCMDAINENSGCDLSSPFGLHTTANSSARQIYLTFPADSTFKEEDVSRYFNLFGPVQDVRIPYQQKRMFGFVTFVHPETVKLILAKGNPHFVCDSRVLVKPYKEKGKFKEKQQQLRLSQSGFDSAEELDTPFGPRMMLTPREAMLRRNLDREAEMQQAIDLHGQRMMNLQLTDRKDENHNLHYTQSFPLQPPLLMNHQLTSSSVLIDQENPEEFGCGKEAAIESDEKKILEGNEPAADTNTGGRDSNIHESLEHVLPDNLFASPTKSAAENNTFCSGHEGGEM